MPRNMNITRQPTDINAAWIENPEQAGLHFVGYADQLARIGHTGWFVNDLQDETMRGVVYEFRGKRHGFVAGHDDPWNDDGAAYVELRRFDDRRDAARYADEIARVCAENEREFQAAENAKMDAEEFVDSYMDAD